MLSTVNLFRPHFLPQDLESLHTGPSVNQPIPLYKGKIELVQDTRTFAGTGTLQLKWLPKPTIVFNWRGTPSRDAVKLLSKPILDLSDLNAFKAIALPSRGDIQLRLSDVTQIITAVITEKLIFYDKLNKKPLSVAGEVEDMEVLPDDPISALVFRVPNFHEFVYPGWRTSVSKPGSLPIPDFRVILNAEGWQVTIDDLVRHERDLLTSNATVAGFALTHIGKLERTDNRPFRAGDAEDMLQCLTDFLSFCRGFFVSPTLVVAFDSTGLRRWEKWQFANSDGWIRVYSWAKLHPVDCLLSVFPGFLRRYQSSVWREPMILGINWYIVSNKCGGGINGSIIHNQAAFELLARTLFVEDLNSISERDFKPGRLPADRKIRELLSYCKIPIDIPLSLTGLCKLANDLSWKDGPEALAKIRNALTHAEPKKRAQVLDKTLARREAWWLGLWYLELALLHLCNYHGTYSNRLADYGVLHSVPWDEDV